VSSATAVPARRGSVLAAGRLPDLLDAHRVEDRGRDLGVLPGGDEEANVALPAGGEEPSRAPRRVGTDDERSLAGDGLVSRPVAGGDRPGQLSDRLIEHGDVVGHGVRAGVARTQHPRKRLTGASAKKNIGWKPKPPLKWGAACSLPSEWISTSVASMSTTTGAVPVVAEDRAQTFFRTVAIADVIEPRTDPSISWKARCTVESEGTEPNSVDWRRRCSMSAQDSPPPASTSAIWVRTLPRSWTAICSPQGGIAPKSASPSPRRSLKAPSAWSPTWATTPVPPGSTFTVAVLLPSTLEVPFLSGICRFEYQQFSLPGGPFHGGAPVSARRLVKDRG
jgi:hypothetical protein